MCELHVQWEATCVLGCARVLYYLKLTKRTRIKRNMCKIQTPNKEGKLLNIRVSDIVMPVHNSVLEISASQCCPFVCIN